MSATHERRKLTQYGERQESIGRSDSYNHSSRGFAHWLEVAPPTTSFAEVADAYKKYDNPHEVWDAGPNHQLTDFGGESQ
jgi:hypothetical protein